MLRSWQLWSLAGEPAPGTLELVDVLESVLRRNPNRARSLLHPRGGGIAQPRARDPERDALDALTPAPGTSSGPHFLQTGDFDPRRRREMASEADRAFVQRTGAQGMYPLMYWTHNIHFISYAQEAYEDAKKAALDIDERAPVYRRC
jgi:hypothetical protein